MSLLCGGRFRPKVLLSALNVESGLSRCSCSATSEMHLRLIVQTDRNVSQESVLPMANMFQMLPIGTDRLVFKTTLTVEEMRTVAMNHERVFILRGFSFNIETGECRAEFVPGNGMCIVQDPLNFPVIRLHLSGVQN